MGQVNVPYLDPALRVMRHVHRDDGVQAVEEQGGQVAAREPAPLEVRVDEPEPVQAPRLARGGRQRHLLGVAHRHRDHASPAVYEDRDGLIKLQGEFAHRPSELQAHRHLGMQFAAI